MQVIKRDGSKEAVSFDKILRRIQRQAVGLSPLLETERLAQKTIEGLYDGVTTHELDELAANHAANLLSYHPDYSLLAARLLITRLYKYTETDPLVVYKRLMLEGIVTESFYENLYAFSQVLAGRNERLESYLDNSRDQLFDYFGYKTLERSYLLRYADKTLAETPQMMYLRSAVALWADKDLNQLEQTYDLLSTHAYTHATPTMQNAGTPLGQLASCFLQAMKEDSIGGIYQTLEDCASISKASGGLGIHVSNIRSTGSPIKGTNGISNGLVPMLRVFNETARYVDQGGGKRKGGLAIYLEPWHADIFEFLDLRKNHGKEELRTRDLFTALWVPDLFMSSVKEDLDWFLMDPNACPGLSDVWGKDFEDLYSRYVAEGNFVKQIKARDLYNAIITSQIETGTPYFLFKDTCNRTSPQQHLGTIKSSNLCAEIIEYSDKDETAVCNLASLSLPAFVDAGHVATNTRHPGINYQYLDFVVRQAVRSLNRVIDVTKYPTEEARRSNLRHRPIGLGIQGLADVFALLNLPFDSQEAKQLNKELMQAIATAAYDETYRLSLEEGSYPTAPENMMTRNSLVLALMPTASTSQIMGNNECFEPFTSNLYTRRTLAGEFMVVNKHLIRDLIDLGLWDDKLRSALILANGSVQDLPVPQWVKDKYKTVWEIKQRVLIDMAADRQQFIDQSQSMNLFLSDPTHSQVASMLMYGWEQGLKTGMYYLRSNAARDAIKFTVEQAALDTDSCSVYDDNCDSCGA